MFLKAPLLPNAEHHLVQKGRNLPYLIDIMQILLGPGGCPWDKEQDPLSLRKYVLEEAYEVIDAIESKNGSLLLEELGDLLLQVVFLSELSRTNFGFGPDDVILSICNKLIRRHPHVFENSHAETSDQVLQNWERIKAEEKKAKGEKYLDSIPRSLPGLVRAQRIGEKVSRVGFDWKDEEGSLQKVQEEVMELKEARNSGDAERVSSEFGDLLFALVNFARHLNIDAESALQKATQKFIKRFEHVESRVHEIHGGWSAKDGSTHSLEALDQYWNEAKNLESI